MAVSAWSGTVTATTASVESRSDWSATVTATTPDGGGQRTYISSSGQATLFTRWVKTSTGKVATSTRITSTAPVPPPPPDPEAPTAATIVIPTDAGYVDVTKAPYNADPTGAVDAWDAIWAAVTANDWIDADPTHAHVDRVASRTLFFPAGTYRIRTGIEIPGSGVRLLGAGEGLTTLKLVDNATGYGSSSSPKYVLRTGTALQKDQDNSGFGNYIQHLTVDVGAGNPGAVGVRFAAANSGSMRHVTIRSSDQRKVGYQGLALDSSTGPCAVFDVTVDGFTTGIFLGSNAINDIVMCGITLKNCLTQGFLNTGKAIAVEALTTVNVPIVYNATSDAADLVLVGANLGGAGTQAAFKVTAASYAWMRDVTASGFTNLVTQGATDLFTGGTSLTEWATHNYRRGNTSQAWGTGSVHVSLNLPYQRAPEYNSTDLSQWASVLTFGATRNNDTDDDGPAIQAAIDSGAKVVYFPYGAYAIRTPVVVRGAVRKIDFCFSMIQNGSSAGFTVDSVTDGVVELANADIIGPTFTQNGSSILVVRDMAIRTGYTSTTGAPGTPTITTGTSATGDIYAESLGAKSNLQINRPVNVWVRQWNRERQPTNISGGAKVWVLGDNVELHDTFVSASFNVSGGAKVELLGGAYDLLNYANAYPTSGRAVYQATDSTLSVVMPSALRSSSLGHWVSDTVSGALVGDVTSAHVVVSTTGAVGRVTVPMYVSP